MPVRALTGNESEAPVTWILSKFSVERMLRSAPPTPKFPRPKALAPDEIARAAKGSSTPQGLAVLPFPKGVSTTLSAHFSPREFVGSPKSQRIWSGVGELG